MLSSGARQGVPTLARMDSMTNAPVLLIGFNRPDDTTQVFEAIRDARPTRLFIAVDGARSPEEQPKVDAVRALAGCVDWPCDVSTLFRDENVGCKLGVSGAIDWFFENVEAGIILEDDCVPTASFFRFCSEMLERYATDTRVMHVAGYNHVPEFVWDPDYSYYFSQYGYMWGWATWKRAWELYDVDIPSFSEVVEKGYLQGALPNRFALKYHMKKIRDAHDGTNDTWDYQWDFVRLTNSGLSVVPHVNMITNIGFGDDATHTVSSKNPSTANPGREIEFPIQHPPFVVVDARSDRAYFTFLARWTARRKLFGLFQRPGFRTEG